jgi:hypothetical protein
MPTPSWLTIVAAGLKLLGLADLAAKMLQSRQDRQRGREQQQNADLNATEKQDAEGRQIDGDVARLGDDELDRRLRGDPVADR